MADLIPWQESWNKASKNREDIRAEELCHFGIKPLDDAMPFISKNELITIGADSGVGKSSLIIDIALHNAMMQKKVAVFYLEGGNDEFMSRVQFKLITEKIIKKTGKSQYFDYISWKCNMMESSLFKDTQNRLFEELEDNLKDNLWVYQVETGFKTEDLIHALYGFHSLEEWIDKEGRIDLDLIIIDHLQYFELTGTENEIMQTTNILRELKHLSDRYKVPVILVSHLRKKGKDRGLPGQEDFYGSSNIPKISTTSIMISADKSKDDYSDRLYPTIMRFVKSRIGIRDTYAIRINYNLNERKYETAYTLHQVSRDNAMFKDSIKYEKLPYWLTKKIQRWEYERMHSE